MTEHKLVLCGTSYEWYECTGCKMKVMGWTDDAWAQEAHDNVLAQGNSGGVLQWNFGWDWTEAK